MSLDPRTPIIIGTGQVAQHAIGLDDAKDPIALISDAITLASQDAGLTSIPNPDALRIVSLLSWRYTNPAYFVAQDLRLEPRELGLSATGGNTPQTLVNIASQQIQRGEIDLVFLAGGETSRTRKRARAAGVELDWRTTDIAPTMVTEEKKIVHPEEIERKMYAPIQLYPMFETAVRAHAGRSVQDHQIHISELWSRFSAVAATNPNAWSQHFYTPEEIRTVSPTNRMIGMPYPKLMNSNNDVDMAAALMVCSVAKAESLGVPRDRWVFMHSGADTHEHIFVSNRNNFYETPAIRIGGKSALELAGLGIDDIDLVDLYSCFPSATQLGAQSLGLDITSQLTRTGGLPFNGGPWNNYVMHAIATMANELRAAPGTKGFIWGNGGFTTKHSFGVYSTEPPKNGFRFGNPQSEIDALPMRDLAVAVDAQGPATIEAYTVMHNREGSPETAYAACLLADGRRAWGQSTDADLAGAMCEGEWVGRSCVLDSHGIMFVNA